MLIIKRYTAKNNQKGMTVGIIIGAMAVLGILGYIGSTVISAIVSSNQKSNLIIQSSQALTQASYILTNETTKNGSGIPVAPAFEAGITNPTGGGVIPNSSAAPKIDAYGTNIGYCTNSATTQSDPVFALIFAGSNKTFDTTCTQALAGTAIGDDKIIVKSVANILQGVGGTVYFGDPVATVADLGNLSAASIKPGQLRTVLADGSIYVNQTGAAGASNWTKVGGANGSGAVTLPIKNVGDACTSTTSGAAPNQNANEGTAITSDRKTLLTCQSNVWTNPTKNPLIVSNVAVGMQSVFKNFLICSKNGTISLYHPAQIGSSVIYYMAHDMGYSMGFNIADGSFSYATTGINCYGMSMQTLVSNGMAFD